MSIEEQLVESLHHLPPEKQRELLAFAEALVRQAQARHDADGVEDSAEPLPSHEFSNLPLGKRLRAIRSRIVESGEGLLTIEEIEQEMAEQRDRLGHFGE